MTLQNNLSEQICITDLAFAKKYKNVQRAPRRVVPFVGTYKYWLNPISSLSAHQHMEQFPKDDLISCLYMFYEFLNGSLPWKGLKNVKAIHIKYLLIFSSLTFKNVHKYLHLSILENKKSNITACLSQIKKLKRDFQLRPPILSQNTYLSRMAFDLSELSGMFTMLEETKP
ncbi:unnamed protein product [Thelazia callipaeda]|uniref:Tau-tubulin kinase 1 n=1 Tax=Thelazia callipaeda TaxID=103827 RepID=A0A0N5CTI3_THECL|nr:unnamed protein product [Thelazia callipaeda]